MYDNYYSTKFLFILLLLVGGGNILFNSKSLKVKSIFYFFYGYLLWAMLLSSGLNFWFNGLSSFQSSFVRAFSFGWIVFAFIYLIKAIKASAHWGEIVATISIAVVLMLFLQLMTGFIFACAGYSDCI